MRAGQQVYWHIPRFAFDDEGETVNTVFMLSSVEGWASGNFGTYHYKQGRWQLQGTGGSNSIYMISSDEGWGVGAYGNISHYIANKWVSVQTPTNVSLRRIFMLAPNDGWAVGEADVLHYDGNRWSKINNRTLRNIIGLNDIYMLSADEGWFASTSGIVHYRAGKWEIANNLPTNTIYMLSANEGWAGGNGLFHYQDGVWTEYKPKDRQ